MICKGKKKNVNCEVIYYIPLLFLIWSEHQILSNVFQNHTNTDAQSLNHEPVKSHTVKIELISILKLSYYNNPPKLT